MRGAGPYRENCPPIVRAARPRLRGWRRVALVPLFFVGFALLATFALSLADDMGPRCHCCNVRADTHFH